MMARGNGSVVPIHRAAKTDAYSPVRCERTKCGNFFQKTPSNTFGPFGSIDPRGNRLAKEIVLFNQGYLKLGATNFNRQRGHATPFTLLKNTQCALCGNTTNNNR